ncbi:Interferon-induced 6-16 family [Microdochium nivale]|nr:Interferon-induced 6-16 family [Microdochium nivale]
MAESSFFNVAGATAIGGLAIMALPGLIVAPAIGVLNMVGFGAGGIVGGTTAATIQAGIGNVAARSLFATCTSAAASGYGVAVLAGAARVAGGAFASAAAGAAAVHGMAD